MITIDSCTMNDAATVAGLWNAKSMDAESCWFQAPAVDAEYVSILLASGFEFVLARDDTAPIGFGIWCHPAESPQLVALAANSDDVYYRLMTAFCAWGLNAGATVGWAELGVHPTAEKSRMDALGVIDYAPSGFAPSDDDQQDPDDRVVVQLRASCDLQILADRLAEVLGNL